MTTSPEQIAHKKGEKQRSVHQCNFRAAGRLSNENARAFTSIHEAMARQLSTMLDAFLGAELQLKLGEVDQVPMSEHVAELPALTYIAAFTFNDVPSTMAVEFDIQLVFPIVDLLLGGVGSQVTEVRDLSEIEEEIMTDLTALIVKQAEMAWCMPADSLSAAQRIKSSMLSKYSAPNEKVMCVRFDIDILGVKGALRFIFPPLFLSVLTQQIKLDQPQQRGAVRYIPGEPLRERILDCDIDLAVELTGLRVSVRDVVAMQPGSVVKLRLPVKTPGMLTASGLGLFEAMPVRNGGQKAAQLGRRILSAAWERK